MLVAGCTHEAQPPTSAATPRASVALRVLVVNDRAVAEAINRLRGEWAERSGGELSATAKPWSEIVPGKELDADAIVFPSRYLGELCDRGWLRPMRSSALESEEFAADDVYPIVRRELMKWGGESMALPLALDVPRPGEPTPDHPGIDFLAAAAPSVVRSDREDALFDPQTMKPRIGDAEFVAALKAFVESSTGKPRAAADAVSVPVLGFADLLVGVATTSRNGASAFKLAAWLASPEISSQLAKEGSHLHPVRRSMPAAATGTESSPSGGEHSSAGANLQAALGGDKCLLVPRIPEVDDYLAALDEAVRAATRDGASPQAALDKAAGDWEKITNTRGRDSQRAAYMKHLNSREP